MPVLGPGRGVIYLFGERNKQHSGPALVRVEPCVPNGDFGLEHRPFEIAIHPSGFLGALVPGQMKH